MAENKPPPALRDRIVTRGGDGSDHAEGVSSARVAPPIPPAPVTHRPHGEPEGERVETVLAEALIQPRSRCSPAAGEPVTQDRGCRTAGQVRVDGAATGLALSHGADLEEEIDTPLIRDRGPLRRLAVPRESRRPVP
ncbi:hypothetical protein [Streptomyces sp. NPDC092903]|uniref:hypothetical protein n=1 Tax=Streptomyces sp. NPDC092903 TaxID=3366017 RepID=UPI0038041FA8